MLFLILLLYPLMLWGIGILISRYDPHSFDPYRYGKYFRQNGKTFFFIKLSDVQWDVFKDRTKKYFNISTIVSIVFCFGVSIIWHDDLRMAMRICSMQFIVINVIVIALAYSQATAHDDEPKTLNRRCCPADNIVSRCACHFTK